MADYKIKKTDKYYVFIIDLDLGNISVTNDAENVVQELAKRYPGKRIFYRDSMGRVDELLVKKDRFAGYRAGNPFGLK